MEGQTSQNNFLVGAAKVKRQSSSLLGPTPTSTQYRFKQMSSLKHDELGLLRKNMLCLMAKEQKHLI